MPEDKIDVTDLLADRWVAGAEAEAGKIIGFEVLRDGLEAIISSAGAAFAIAELAKLEIKIVADYKEILRGELVEV